MRTSAQRSDYRLGPGRISLHFLNFLPRARSAGGASIEGPVHAILRTGSPGLSDSPGRRSSFIRIDPRRDLRGRAGCGGRTRQRGRWTPLPRHPTCPLDEATMAPNLPAPLSSPSSWLSRPRLRDGCHDSTWVAWSRCSRDHVRRCICEAGARRASPVRTATPHGPTGRISGVAWKAAGSARPTCRVVCLHAWPGQTTA